MEDQFEILKGSEGRYSISRSGVIKTHSWNVIRPSKGSFFKKEKLIKQCLNRKGYSMVGLMLYGKQTSIVVHRLVAIQWLQNPNNKPEVNHINGIKTDNRVENLEWVTTKENCQHASRIGLYSKARSILMMDEKRNPLKQFNSINSASRETGISMTAIIRAADGITKNGRYHKFKWAYV